MAADELEQAGPLPPPPALPRRRLLGAGALVALVLDDVAVNRRLPATVLARAGYALQGAAGAEIALMDVEMPGLDGLAATQRLRAMPGAAAKLPFIAVTAHRSEGGEARAREAWMDDYLIKPAGSSDVARILAAVAGRGATAA